MNKKADDLFKEIAKEDELETSSEDNIVDIKYIGKFKVMNDNLFGWLELESIIEGTKNIFLKSCSGGRVGLMKFMRFVFKSQNTLKNKNNERKVLTTMEDCRDHVDGSLKVTQYIAEAAKENDNKK